MWFLSLYIFIRLFWRAHETLVRHPLVFNWVALTKTRGYQDSSSNNGHYAPSRLYLFNYSWISVCAFPWRKHFNLKIMSTEYCSPAISISCKIGLNMGLYFHGSITFDLHHEFSVGRIRFRIIMFVLSRFNPVHVKFIIGNIKIYLQFISFLHTDMTWVVKSCLM